MLRTPIKLLLLATLLAAFGVGCADNTVQHNNGGWDIGANNDSGHADVGDTNRADTDHTDTRRSDVRPRDTSPPDTDASHDVGPDEYEINFELRNESGRTVYASERVHGQGPCQNTPAWLTVSRNGEPIDMSDGCETCNCDDQPCAVCSAVCPEPPPSIGSPLAPGASRTDRWDGVAWLYDQPNQCEFAESLVNETLAAKFCWTTLLSPGDQSSAELRCETVRFDIDAHRQTVEFVIPAGRTPPPPPPPTCDAQDAAGRGACANALGVRWTGSICKELSGCECAGEDCEDLFASKSACADAYDQCPYSCGGVAGYECPVDRYCDIEPAGQGCLSTGGYCEPRPTGCPAVAMPVCGCDGTSYNNSCEAAAAGVDVASDGACDHL